MSPRTLHKRASPRPKCKCSTTDARQLAMSEFSAHGRSQALGQLPSPFRFVDGSRGAQASCWKAKCRVATGSPSSPTGQQPCLSGISGEQGWWARQKREEEKERREKLTERRFGQGLVGDSQV